MTFMLGLVISASFGIVMIIIFLLVYLCDDDLGADNIGHSFGAGVTMGVMCGIVCLIIFGWQKALSKFENKTTQDTVQQTIDTTSVRIDTIKSKQVKSNWITKDLFD